MRFLTFLLAVLLPVACRQPDRSPRESRESTAEQVPKQDSLPSFRGLLSPDPQGFVFRDCASPGTFLRVLDASGQLEDLYRYNTLENYPDEALIAELKGRRLDTLGGPGLLVSEVNDLVAQSYDNICIPFEYYCQSSEPLWWINISKAGGMIDFRDLGQKKGWHFPYKTPVEKGGVRTYQAASGSHSIRIAIRQVACTDPVTGQLFPASATVVLDGKTFSGCAVAYGQRIRDN